MKARHWLEFMETQRHEHGKTVFSVTELANAGNTSLHSVNVELARLVKQGIIVRYSRGKYGLPGNVSPEELVSAVDKHAYLTGSYALYRHNLITQIPSELTCFTNRRHNRSRVRTTPAGRLVFVCVNERVYCKPRDGIMAAPEQALCDLVYLLRRRRLRPEGLFTFRNLDKVRELEHTLEKYPDIVRKTVLSLVMNAPGH